MSIKFLYHSQKFGGNIHVDLFMGSLLGFIELAVHPGSNRCFCVSLRSLRYPAVSCEFVIVPWSALACSIVALMTDITEDGRKSLLRAEVSLGGIWE